MTTATAEIPTAPTATGENPAATAPDSDLGLLKRIPLAKIVPDPTQPRKKFDPDKLAALAASMRQRQVEPIIVFENPDGSGTFVLIGGERRWRAAQIGNIPALKACVVEQPGSAVERLALALSSNAHEDLTVTEKAKAWSTLAAAGKLQQEIAETSGTSAITVGKYLRLTSLHPDLWALLDAEDEAERLTLSAAAELLRLADQADQLRAWRRTGRGGGARTLKRIADTVKQMLGGGAARDVTVRTRTRSPEQQNQRLLTELRRMKESVVELFAVDWRTIADPAQKEAVRQAIEACDKGWDDLSGRLLQAFNIEA